MATVTELPTCAGFTVEAPGGLLGWVEEARRDELVIRTPDGGRGSVPLADVRAIDPDAQEVLVRTRRAEAPEERPLWQILAFTLGGLATLVTAEIGLMFLVAWLVTGHAY
jgi:hypothetical protein